MNRKINQDYLKYIIFSFYFLIGVSIYKDYGIGIEEHFQRQNGFYWLKYFLSFTNFEDLKSIASTKYENILITDPNLPKSDFFNFYGIVFDVPLAFIETFFNINSSKTYFEIRHLSIFIIFFISTIFFNKILENRFKYFPAIIFGTIIYIISPRIFGDSFYNNKDLLFLSFLVIANYFAFKFFENKSTSSLIFFCLFSAVATSSRIFGLYLPIIFLIFYFFEYICKKVKTNDFFKIFFKVLLFYLFFLYLHYPYIWKLNILEVTTWLSSFFYFMDYRMLFNGDYFHIKYLPRSYLPIWIFITTPLYVILLFLLGAFFTLKRFFVRVVNIKKEIGLSNDLWTSTNEKKDLFVFISFSIFFFYVLFFNVFMVSGWRYFYFLNVFIVYFFSLGLYFLRINLKKYCNENFFLTINFLLTLIIVFDLYKFHPYQSLYFNRIFSANKLEKFQIDTPSLSRVEALKIILKDSKQDQVYVANTSWTPLRNGQDLLEEKDKKRLIYVGQNLKKADYIYTNHIYLHKKEINKRYQIPDNFYKIKVQKINNIEIYSIYKKK